MGRGGFCCLHCCDGLCNGIARMFNIVLMLAGFGIAGFGLYLAAQTNWTFDYFTITVCAVGGCLGLLTGVYSCCGHKSYSYNTVYIYATVLLVIGDAIAAGVLFTQKDKIVASLKKELGPINSKFLDGTNITITGYVAAGLAGLQVLALVLAWCHRRILLDIERDRIDLEDGYEELDSNLLTSENTYGNSNRQQRTAELASRSTKSTDIESEGAQAASKYRSKYADLYTKYGIDK